MFREGFHPRRPPIKGCCLRGDHKRREKPKPQPPRPPTEPCHICLNVVGLEAENNFVETWVVLPCGHKFGSLCLKTWLGLNERATCPICKKSMAHICGHPTLPRHTTPPEYDPADIQPGEDRVPGTLNSNPSSEPEEADAQLEAQVHIVEEDSPVANDDGASAQNEKVETNKEANKDAAAGCGSTVSEKNIQTATQRVPSSSSGVHSSQPMESIFNDNNNNNNHSGNGNDNGDDNRNDQNSHNDAPASNEPPAVLEEPGAHEAHEAQQSHEEQQAQQVQQAPNNEQLADVAPLAQQELLAEPAALQPAQEPQPPAIPQAAHPVSPNFAPAHAQNSRPRRSLRQWLHLARQPTSNTGPPDPFKQSPLPIGSASDEDHDDYDILAGLMTSGKVPSQVPKYMNMAFPRTVDLSVPCSYCFMMLDAYMREAGDHIRRRPKISKTKRSCIPGKALAIVGAKYFFAYSFYAISTVLRAITVDLDDYLSGKGKLTEREKDRLQAYFNAMDEARSASFHIWWGRQQPVTKPAVMVLGRGGWYYSYGYYH